MKDVQPENSENSPSTSAGSAPVRDEQVARDLNDPNATFADLPHKPQLTEKQAKRANQTLKGMILSVAFCIAVFLPLYFLNPQPSNQAFESSIDLQGTAQDASRSSGYELFAPSLPQGQYANFARWQENTAQGVPYWEFGVVEQDKKFVWVRQSAAANPTWIALITEAATPAGTKDIGGVDWELRTKDNTEYLISKQGKSTVILSSDTGENELVQMAQLVNDQVN